MFMYSKYKFSVQVYYLAPTNDHSNLHVHLRSHFMTYIKGLLYSKTTARQKSKNNDLFFLLHHFLCIGI